MCMELQRKFKAKNFFIFCMLHFTIREHHGFNLCTFHS
ncbi:hypothetical protein SL1157_2773 [Ruegeria lacuscaerulensis ITI-1157]|nr:hypothetical protein SL1157_2773 [Ruegeria lacuscaerulensis ITI-1157]